VAGCWGNSNEPSCSIKGGDILNSCVTVSSSRRTLHHGVGNLCKELETNIRR
jgi:hypothetical protein